MPHMNRIGNQVADTQSAHPAIDKSPGSISLISGCMFSGKTTELLKQVARFPQESVRLFKHVCDTRYAPDAVVTHNGIAFPAIAVHSASTIVNHITSGVRVVGIDEGHFFDGQLLNIAQGIAQTGVDVIVTALDRDSWGRPLPISSKLEAASDNSETRTTACSQCADTATRTQRLTPIINGNMIGGEESYEPRCKRCWKAPPEAPLQTDSTIRS